MLENAVKDKDSVLILPDPLLAISNDCRGLGSFAMQREPIGQKKLSGILIGVYYAYGSIPKRTTADDVKKVVELYDVSERYENVLASNNAAEVLDFLNGFIYHDWAVCFIVAVGNTEIPDGVVCSMPLKTVGLSKIKQYLTGLSIRGDRMNEIVTTFAFEASSNKKFSWLNPSRDREVEKKKADLIKAALVELGSYGQALGGILMGSIPEAYRHLAGLTGTAKDLELKLGVCSPALTGLGFQVPEPSTVAEIFGFASSAPAIEAAPVAAALPSSQPKTQEEAEVPAEDGVQFTREIPF